MENCNGGIVSKNDMLTLLINLATNQEDIDRIMKENFGAENFEEKVEFLSKNFRFQVSDKKDSDTPQSIYLSMLKAIVSKKEFE